MADTAPAEPPPRARTPWLHHPGLYILLGLVAIGLELASTYWAWPRPTAPLPQEQRPEPQRRPLAERLEELRRESLGHDASVAAALVLIVPLLAGSALLLGYLVLRSCDVRILRPCRFQPATWDAWHLLRALTVLIVLMQVGSATLGWAQASEALGGWADARTGDTLLALAYNAALFIVVSLFVVALVAAGDPGPLRAIGLREGRPASRLAVGLAALLMLLPVIMLARLVTFIYGPLVGVHPEDQGLVNAARTGPPVVFAALVFTGVVIAPITEEILFRGFLYTTLRRYVAPLGAITISAVVFSLAHGFAFGFLQLFVIGFLLAYLYERTGSLAASMAAHAANNLYSFLVIWVAYR